MCLHMFPNILQQSNMLYRLIYKLTAGLSGCRFLQLTVDLSRGYPAFFYPNFLRIFFVLC